MLRQEELTRNLVSISSQALYATVSTANSVLFWISSLTPVASESLSKAGASIFGAPFFSHEESATPDGNDATVEPGLASYYLNAVHTIIFILTIWIYFKTLSLVWRSVSVAWKTTVGVCKIVGFFASKLGLSTKFWGLLRLIYNEELQEKEEDDASNRGRNSRTGEELTQTNATAAAPERRTFAPSQFSPHRPIGVVWYYHPNSIPRNETHWLPPPPPPPPLHYPPPFAPVPMGAPFRHRQGLPPQDSFFVPISGTRVERRTEQNNRSTNIENDNYLRMENSRHEFSMRVRSPPDKNCTGGGDQNADVLTMGTSGQTAAANESNTERTIANDATVAREKTFHSNCNAPNDDAAALAHVTGNPKKRKAAPERALSPRHGDSEMDEDMLSTEPSETTGKSPTKKQRREVAKANARFWAEKTLGSNTD